MGQILTAIIDKKEKFISDYMQIRNIGFVNRKGKIKVSINPLLREQIDAGVDPIPNNPTSTEIPSPGKGGLGVAPNDAFTEAQEEMKQKASRRQRANRADKRR